MRLRQQLLIAAAVFGEATGRGEPAVSKFLFGSGNRLPGIRKGAGIVSDNAEDALERLSASWPEGVAWPDQVPRPVPSALRPAGALPADAGAVRKRRPRRPAASAGARA